LPDAYPDVRKTEQRVLLSLRVTQANKALDNNLPLLVILFLLVQATLLMDQTTQAIDRAIVYLPVSEVGRPGKHRIRAASPG
jgi:hypothetical protein